MNEHPIIALPKGYRLQEYELVRVLGIGGFGVTYLGYDHNLEMPVAIKEYLPTDIAVRADHLRVAPQASQFREDFEWGLGRFLHEARTLAGFDHRNIIRVRRYFEANGTAFIVMEYAEGETLAAHIARTGTIDATKLKRVLLPILDGLKSVHCAEFLHRDIKPGNIVIRVEDDSPVLIDFGAARHAVGNRSRSVTIMITPGYAPVEQYSSKGKQGPWTDIYALGAVCYKALTGETPVDSIDRLNDDPLDSVAIQCAAKGSEEFLRAIDWALVVEESGRPQTIDAWQASISGGNPRQAKTTSSKKTKEDHTLRNQITPVNDTKGTRFHSQKGRLKMNGWQRAWVFFGVFWLLFWLLGALNVGNESTGFVWQKATGTFTIGLALWLFVYAFGMGVAWVMRGFKSSPE